MKIWNKLRKLSIKYHPLVKKWIILLLPLIVLFVIYNYIIPVYQNYTDAKVLDGFAKEGKQGEFGILGAYAKFKPYDGTLSEKVELSAIPYLEGGIAKIKKEGEVYFHPVLVSQYALENWEIWLNTADHKNYTIFIRHADALLRNQEIINDKFGVWYYNFDWPSGGMKAPWVSAMAQGQAISVLIRAWQVTGEGKYLETARLSVESFKVDISDGGVKNTKGDLVYYEEYPKLVNAENISSFQEVLGSSEQTLNGFIFAIFGLYDYYLATGDYGVQKLFDEGIKTLKTDINSYDLGVISAYDQTKFTPKNLRFRIDSPDKFKILSITLDNKEKVNLNQSKASNCSIMEGWKVNKQFGCTQLKDLGKVHITYQGESGIILKTYVPRIGYLSVRPSYTKTLTKTSNLSVFNLPKELLTRRSTVKYHNVHVEQLNDLCSAVEDDFFCSVSEKWKKYQPEYLTHTKKFVFPEKSETTIHASGFVANRIFNKFKDYYKPPFGLTDFAKILKTIKVEFSKGIL